jgi:hypothetical protein
VKDHSLRAQLNARYDGFWAWLYETWTDAWEMVFGVWCQMMRSLDGFVDVFYHPWKLPMSVVYLVLLPFWLVYATAS